jgi:outer membrane protein OmpA-like peptidoglycan-associated protein
MRTFFSRIAFFSAVALLGLGAQAFGQSFPTPTDYSTGHMYVGADLGLTYSWYLGGSNFFWPETNAPGGVYNLPNSIATPIRFDNMGGGIGGIFGIKGAIPLSNSFDLEGKLRYVSNYTSRTEAQPLPVVNTGLQENVTNSYSLLLSNLDLAALIHFALSTHWYAAGGLSFSGLLADNLTASQTLPPGSTYVTNSGNSTSITQQVIPSGSQPNMFNGSRLDLQVGAGTILPFSSDAFAIDAELLVSIPLTSWLDASQQANFDQFANYITTRDQSFGENVTVVQPTFPSLWYASLTIGVRFPFGNQTPVEAAAGSTSEVGPDGKVALTGTVTDAQTGAPVDADMTVVDLTNNQVVATGHTDRDGRYNVRAKAPGKYSVTADADGYLFGTAYFQVDDQGRILARHPDIKLSKTSGGRTRLLVFFNTGSADLNESSYPELDRAVRLMKAVPAMRVEIAGYTDSVGNEAYNLDLSQKRADAVRNYITEHGIPQNRVTAHGYGKESPIADNGTESGRAENRRVEFIVMSN